MVCLSTIPGSRCSNLSSCLGEQYTIDCGGHVPERSSANISVNAPVYIVNMYRKSVQQLCACYTRDLTLERLFSARLLYKQALFRVVLVSLTKRDFVRKLQAGRVMA